MEADIVLINRAPVLTLWATLVAERMGYDHEAALTLGKAVAGLNAQSKGRSLGIYGPPKPGEGGGAPKKQGLGEDYWVTVCGRPVPVKDTPEGTRAVVLDQPIGPASVEKYLTGKFGEDFDRTREALRALTQALSPEGLAEMAYDLYERFRPQIPRGKRGWGQAGELDLGLVRKMAKEAGGG